MSQHLLVKMHQLCVVNLGNSLAMAIDALIWCIFPAQLNDPELISGSLVEPYLLTWILSGIQNSRYAKSMAYSPVLMPVVHRPASII